MMRWQGLSEQLSSELQPQAELVPFAGVRDYLPKDVPFFSTAQRANQIHDRRLAIQHRFGD